MLRELQHTRQIPGGPPRRWFSSPGMDLILWYEGGRIAGFQLCYDKDSQEKAATWKPHASQLEHSRISDGEEPGLGYKQTPVLTDDVAIDIDRVVGLFRREAMNMPADIRQHVLGTLERSRA